MTKRLLTLAALVACCGWLQAATAAVLLDDTFADGDRTDTNLPTESAVYVGVPSSGGAVNVSPGVLSQSVGDSSMKIWTYFAADGNEVSLAPGEKLVATIDFQLKGNLYDNTSRSFRLGVYNDPTDPNVLVDVNSDGGGSGNPWSDATGYAIQIPFTAGPSAASPFQIFKRVNVNTSLLGSGGAMSSSPSGGTAVTQSLDTPYSLQFVIDRVSANQVNLTATLSDANGVLSTHTVSDDGSTFASGGLPGSGDVYTTFDHLFIRTSNNTSTADQIDYTRINVAVVPEPATLLLAGVAALAALGARRRG